MTVNLAFVSHTIDMMAQRGILAAEIHLSPETHKWFVAAMLACGMAEKPVKPSRKKVVWKFRNIPLVINDKIADQGLLIRPLHLLGVENWIERCMEEHREMAEARTKLKPTDAAITANDFVRAAPQSVTDILIDAATNCDDVQKVIVVCVKGDSEIKIMTNASRFETFGLLQCCVSKVAQGD